MRRLFITSLFLLVTAGSFAQGTNDQRVDMPEKGVYIMNGKKVVIK